jgi:hypothetical protein
VATQPRIAFRAVRTLSGMSVPREYFPDAASQTFKKGAPVFLRVGYLEECGTDPVLIMGVATRDGQNGSTAGAKSQTVELAHPDTLFLGNVDAGSAGTGVTAATTRGRMLGITKHSSSGKWSVDVDKGTAALKSRVVVWDFYLNAQDGATQAIGDTLGWVLFAFDPAYFQGQKTS